MPGILACWRQVLDIKKINDRMSVSGQIQPEDVQAIKQAGFVSIINNRPDGEAPDQPSSAAIGEAARAAGLGYYEIPMGREGVTSDGPVFAFCRSGTRSTTLWALSQAGKDNADTIIDSAAKAGYDMSHLAAHLDKPLS
jgi:sulfide:quinone oxidoreductase